MVENAISTVGIPFESSFGKDIFPKHVVKTTDVANNNPGFFGVQIKRSKSPKLKTHQAGVQGDLN